MQNMNYDISAQEAKNIRSSELLEKFSSSESGLSKDETKERLKKYLKSKLYC